MANVVVALVPLITATLKDVVVPLMDHLCQNCCKKRGSAVTLTNQGSSISLQMQDQRVQEVASNSLNTVNGVDLTSTDSVWKVIKGMIVRDYGKPVLGQLSDVIGRIEARIHRGNPLRSQDLISLYSACENICMQPVGIIATEEGMRGISLQDILQTVQELAPAKQTEMTDEVLNVLRTVGVDCWTQDGLKEMITRIVRLRNELGAPPHVQIIKKEWVQCYERPKVFDFFLKWQLIHLGSINEDELLSGIRLIEDGLRNQSTIDFNALRALIERGLDSTHQTDPSENASPSSVT